MSRINEYIKIEKNNIGSNIIRIDSDQIQWIITPDGEYQFMDDKLVEVPPPSIYTSLKGFLEITNGDINNVCKILNELK